MSTWIAVGISGLALIVSALTAWFTFLRRGDLRMTQPTVVFLGPDGGRRDGEKPHLKVFLRTLLYSTSRRGQTVESMHVNLQQSESKQNFSIWVYGDQHLVRGSGIYVGPDGIACNHHFLLSENGSVFRLLPGRYTVRVYGKRTSDSDPREMIQLALTISEADAQRLAAEDAGIYFDWEPDQQAYHSHIEIKKTQPLPPWLLSAAG
jgi:hypothetical protein